MLVNVCLSAAQAFSLTVCKILTGQQKSSAHCLWQAIILTIRILSAWLYLTPICHHKPNLPTMYSQWSTPLRALITLPLAVLTSAVFQLQLLREKLKTVGMQQLPLMKLNLNLATLWQNVLTVLTHIIKLFLNMQVILIWAQHSLTMYLLTTNIKAKSLKKLKTLLLATMV